MAGANSFAFIATQVQNRLIWRGNENDDKRERKKLGDRELVRI